MRKLTAIPVLALAVSAVATANAHSAATIYCEANDSSVVFDLKGMPGAVSVLVEAYSLELRQENIARTAETPMEATGFNGLIFGDLDQMALKVEFDDPRFLFEANLANAGTVDDGINWQGAYKVTFQDRLDTAPLRGAVSCVDGY